MKPLIRTMVGIPHCARNDINAEKVGDFIKGNLRMATWVLYVAAGYFERIRTR